MHNITGYVHIRCSKTNITHATQRSFFLRVDTTIIACVLRHDHSKIRVGRGSEGYIHHGYQTSPYFLWTEADFAEYTSRKRSYPRHATPTFPSASNPAAAAKDDGAYWSPMMTTVAGPEKAQSSNTSSSEPIQANSANSNYHIITPLYQLC